MLIKTRKQKKVWQKTAILITSLIAIAIAINSPFEYKIVLIPTQALAQQEAPEPIFIEKMTAIVTAYTSDPMETDDTPEIMASGKKVYAGAVACPRRLPFGTKVQINGEVYTCEDRMAKKYDDRFDIWHETKASAIAFGKQENIVKIWDTDSE